jgi:hypothetical protein
VGSGPYVVLPFFGPSTVRDGIALFGLDYQVDPVWNLNDVAARNTLYSVRAVDRRTNALDTVRVMEEAALDKYRFVRDSYLQRRRNLIYDGDPPREREPEESSSARPAPLLTALPVPGQAAGEASGNETVTPPSDMTETNVYPAADDAAPVSLYTLR